jgi:hypothetical protein
MDCWVHAPQALSLSPPTRPVAPRYASPSFADRVCFAPVDSQRRAPWSRRRRAWPGRIHARRSRHTDRHCTAPRGRRRSEADVRPCPIGSPWSHGRGSLRRRTQRVIQEAGPETRQRVIPNEPGHRRFGARQHLEDPQPLFRCVFRGGAVSRSMRHRSLFRIACTIGSGIHRSFSVVSRSSLIRGIRFSAMVAISFMIFLRRFLALSRLHTNAGTTSTYQRRARYPLRPSEAGNRSDQHNTMIIFDSATKDRTDGIAWRLA